MTPWVSYTADVIGILAAVFALFGWIQSRRVKQYLENEQQRLNRTVRILLSWNQGQDVIELPGKLRKEDLTRGEILGVLGMIPMKVPGKRFELLYLSTADFYEQLNHISAESEDSTLIIYTTAEEIDQFDRGKYPTYYNPTNGLQIFTQGKGS